jgi:hypothetical protein
MHLNLILVEYLDVPAACGKAEVIDWAPTFADLVWAPPPWDGGTPILSYIIQMKGRSIRATIIGTRARRGSPECGVA